MSATSNILRQEIVKLLKNTHGIHAHKKILATLDNFKILASDFSNIPKGITVKNTLAEELLQLWQNENDDLNSEIDEILMRYNIDCIGQKTVVSAKIKVKSTNKSANSKMGQVKKNSKKNYKKPQNDPIGGGPPKRAKSRGQCPKCHSTGLVLARSCSGDDYYSCIYCGFQSFKPGLSSELETPLAEQLLGRNFQDDLTKE